MRLMRRKDWLALLLLLTLPALALGAEQEVPETEEESSETEEAEGPTLDERLDALLAEVSAYENRDPQRCLNTRSYRTVKVLNTEYLLFSRGNKYWLNKLKRDCPALKFNDLPVFESRGSSSLCVNDPFYPSNRMDLQYGLSGSRPTVFYGTCHLGDFEPITAEQAALLTEQP
jgi:hypothetical protein